MLYLTGRHRSVELSGSIVCDEHSLLLVHPMGGPIKHFTDTDITISFAFGYVKLSGMEQRPGDISDQGEMSSSLLRNEMFYRLWSWTLFSDLSIVDSPHVVLFIPSSPEFGGSLSGSYRFRFELEEVVDVQSPPVGSSLWPDFGRPGYFVADAPVYTRVRFYERLRVGTEISAEISLGGVSVTSSGIVSESVELSDYSVVRSISINKSDALSSDASLSLDFLGSYLPESYHHSGFDGYVSSSGSVMLCHLNSGGTRRCSLYVRLSPFRSYSLSGLVYFFNDSPSSFYTVRIVRSASDSSAQLSIGGDGSFTDSSEQHRYYVVGSVGSSLGLTLTRDDFALFRCWLDSSSLSLSGDDLDDWRILLHGYLWPSVRIFQSSDYVVCEDFVVSGSSVHVVSFPVVRNFSGYRYLSYRVRSDGEGSLGIRIGVKEWLRDRGGSILSVGSDWVEHVIDLCNPWNSFVSVDLRDTRWPSPCDVDTVSGDGSHWGVCSVSGLEFFGLSPSSSYEFADIRLIRTGVPYLSVLPGFKSWVLSNISGVMEVRTRFLYALTDGRLSLEEYDFSRQSTGSGFTYTFRSLEELVSAVVASGSSSSDGDVQHPGWHAESLSPVSSDCFGVSPLPLHCLRSNASPAVYLGGSGLLYGSFGWRFCLDLPAGSGSMLGTVGLDAQLLFDELDWYPGCGDAFQLFDGSYGGSIKFGAHKFLRGSCFGLVLGSSSVISGGLVTLFRSFDSLYSGQGISSSLGFYRTGSPYGISGFAYFARLEHGSPPFLEGYFPVFYSRRYHRCSFRFSPSILVHGAIDVSSLRSWLALGLSSRVLRYDVLSSVLMEESPVHPIDSWFRFRFDDVTGILYLLGRVGGFHIVYRSLDSGISLEVILSVESSSALIEHDSIRDWLVFLYSDSSGLVWRRVSMDGGLTWSSSTVVKLGSVQLQGYLLDITCDIRSGGVLFMVVDVLGSTQVLSSMDFGESWSVLIS